MPWLFVAPTLFIQANPEWKKHFPDFMTALVKSKTINTNADEYKRIVTVPTASTSVSEAHQSDLTG